MLGYQKRSYTVTEAHDYPHKLQLLLYCFQPFNTYRQACNTRHRSYPTCDAFNIGYIVWYLPKGLTSTFSTSVLEPATFATCSTVDMIQYWLYGMHRPKHVHSDVYPRVCNIHIKAYIAYNVCNVYRSLHLVQCVQHRLLAWRDREAYDKRIGPQHEQRHQYPTVHRESAYEVCCGSKFEGCPRSRLAKM